MLLLQGLNPIQENNPMHWVIILLLIILMVVFKVWINKRRKQEVEIVKESTNSNDLIEFQALSEIEKVSFIINKDVDSIPSDKLEPIKKEISKYAIYWDNLNQMQETQDKYGRLAPALVNEHKEKAKLQMESIKLNLQNLLKTIT
ncbi:hypothetical protein MY04_5530 [Flammeovirga sp. MY04]|uniref:hypothetical protein n=1 Tax=Flammeovirga sp. MY04 TaxID=1191459 RepID=UPI00082569BD|nr:hypothetical protein [Flammeovirga sp. MY04]ANQ52861.2 hypothetical protein MY04_5530 [Flammeovirga sp. MY04]